MTLETLHDDGLLRLVHGDALAAAQELADESVQTIVTSPPYFGLRDYGEDGQYGAEESVEEYVERLVLLFRELRRALTDDGTLWLNLGDSYASAPGAQRGKSSGIRGRKQDAAQTHASSSPRRKPGVDLPRKSLLGVPWRVAFALQADGWLLRSDIVWAKPGVMPESVTDRPTRSHEYIFLFAKGPAYYYDADAIAETASGAGSGNGFNRPEQITRGGAGQERKWEGRPQLRRALEIAEAAGLTEEHFAAMRAVGMSDAGKARDVQAGAGRNSEKSQRLAAEAKEVLGGYYREFLTGGTRNKRDVWTVATVPFKAAHFAVYPPELIRPCILAGSRPGDLVLDPFSGSGTTGQVAMYEGRRYVGFDLNREYLELSMRERFAQPTLDLGAIA